MIKTMTTRTKSKPRNMPVATTTDQESTTGKTMIHIKDLCAWYGDFQALHDISLDIRENEVTAFIGPSGCGKSTLLKWCNRMNDVVPGAVARGALELPDLNILARSTDVVALRRRIGIVFQKPNPFPKSIYDNIAFGPRMHFKKLSKTDLDELVEWALRKAAVWDEVKDRLRKSALGLSGGQQQRLCIARAIAVGPEILLMDEPCSALDPASTARIEDLIFELREQYTICLLYTSPSPRDRTRSRMPSSA